MSTFVSTIINWKASSLNNNVSTHVSCIITMHFIHPYLLHLDGCYFLFQLSFSSSNFLWSWPLFWHISIHDISNFIQIQLSYMHDPFISYIHTLLCLDFRKLLFYVCTFILIIQLFVNLPSFWLSHSSCYYVQIQFHF
jgi:hypothetical protein